MTALSQSLALICVKQNLANSPFVPLHRFSLASRTLQAISAEVIAWDGAVEDNPETASH